MVFAFKDSEAEQVYNNAVIFYHGSVSTSTWPYYW